MSDTPRTDELFNDCGDADCNMDQTHGAMVGLARTLERELNEWLSLQVWGETPALVSEFISAQQLRIKATQDIERELNEAKAEIERLRIDNAGHAYSISELRMRIGLEPGGNYSEVVEAYERVVKERNEAREALSDMLSQTVRIGGDVWELPSCSTDEVNRWRKAAGLEEE